MIYYALNKNIEGNKILSDIQKLISKYPQNELVNKILIVKLESITDHKGDNPIPKLEYKG
jgi:hypothetical protein